MKNLQLKSIAVFLLLFMVAVCTVLAESVKNSNLPTVSNGKHSLIDPKQIQTESGELQRSSDRIRHTNNTYTLVVSVVVSIFFGGLAGAITNVIYAQCKQNKEYRSLIVAFCVELVSAFERCVTYYEQFKNGVISYSILFDFTHESTLSKFASVTKKPEVIAAIVELKSKYFQIGRHVHAAASLAMQGTSAKDECERDRLMTSASSSQGTAIAFFKSSYESIEKNTDLILEAAKQISPGNLVENISSKFTLAKEKKIGLDNEA